MIKPTVGRQIWYWQNDFIQNFGAQPLTAAIAYVWTDSSVNLQVIDYYSVAMHGRAFIFTAKKTAQRLITAARTENRCCTRKPRG